ncbi:unnamed protein product [Ostreobium quekettii]|uniref:BTB domain-containing protein n=1 Tax=Ostreobium quekettii TaxID=121088 RepID=A0A8S1J7F2_9CHLO|nr:unnamed protein product [Ostreobium quekettii]|eukprot:evm.model.scf_251.2 EVM.evm.TU.scf_251.2   scf_251:73105-74208(+)
MSLFRSRTADGSSGRQRIVNLNVGGVRYTTTPSTLSAEVGAFFDILLSGRWEPDVDGQGSIFIDRNGDLFKHVLEYLRARSSGDSRFRLPLHSVDELLALEREASYYQLPGLQALCRDQIHGFGSLEPVIVVSDSLFDDALGFQSIDRKSEPHTHVYWRVRNVWHIKEQWCSPRFNVDGRQLELSICPGDAHFKLVVRLWHNKDDCEPIGWVWTGTASQPSCKASMNSATEQPRARGPGPRKEVDFIASFEGWHDFGQNNNELVVDHFVAYETMLFPWLNGHLSSEDGMLVVRLVFRFVDMVHPKGTSNA